MNYLKSFEYRTTSNNNTLIIDHHAKPHKLVQCFDADGNLLNDLTENDWYALNRFNRNIYAVKGDSLQDAMLRLVAARVGRQENDDRRYQETMTEMYAMPRGWYELEIECSVDDFQRGGWKQKCYRCQILADNGVDAYNKAAADAEDKFGAHECEPIYKANITYIGILTDEAVANF